MKIFEVKGERRQYMDLLLEADEQESMIERYINKGRMFVIDDGGVKAECIVTDEGNGVLEIKNIAVAPQFRGRGLGRRMIEYLIETFRGKYSAVQAGTGDSPLTVPFYEKCGFVRSHTVRDFFTDNYDRPIYEGGVLLRDMVYFRREIPDIEKRGEH